MNQKERLKELSNGKGITLIALVVTIIVLIILAGISINLILGDNGIITKAKEAKEAQTEAEVKEKVAMILAEYAIETEFQSITFLDFLQEKKNNQEIDDITDNGDGTITLQLNGYQIIVNTEKMKIEDIFLNSNFVKISFSAKIAKPNEEVQASITTGKNMTILKWSYIADGTAIGTQQESYTNDFTSSPIGLVGITEENYYLHLLIKDNENGSLSEKIAGPIKVGNYVTSIILNKEQISLEVGKTETLIVTIEPTDATNQTVNWTSSNQSVATVDKNTGEITAVGEGTAKITVEANDGSGVTASCSVTVTRTAMLLDSNKYTWEVMNELAEYISDNYGTGEQQYNKATTEVTTKINGEEYNIRVGDTLNLTDTNNNTYTVRILGFNHDKLVDTSVYGETNTYAGISFEFVTVLTSSRLYSSNTSGSAGWATSALRTTLNGTTLETLNNKDYIKEVEKNYIKTYNTPSSLKTCNDKLWLLACSEIWQNYGYAITSESTTYSESDEQIQYKYYLDKVGSTEYSSTTDIGKTTIEGEGINCWLRSQDRTISGYFAYLASDGQCGRAGAAGVIGIAPGFSI